MKRINREYLEFRVLKLEKLLIPTIQNEIRTASVSDEERYKAMLSEYRLELKERKKTLERYR